MKHKAYRPTCIIEIWNFLPSMLSFGYRRYFDQKIWGDYCFYWSVMISLQGYHRYFHKRNLKNFVFLLKYLWQFPAGFTYIGFHLKSSRNPSCAWYPIKQLGYITQGLFVSNHNVLSLCSAKLEFHTPCFCVEKNLFPSPSNLLFFSCW